MKEEARYLFIEMKTYILTLLIIVVFHLPVYNQNYNLSFDHLTVLEGLSQSTIFSITQDKKGFIWIATRNGLNRYDSHEIKTYKNDPNSPSSLPSNTINALLVDSKGQLWVGTNKGVCLYNQENDNFTPIINLSDKGSKPATYSINVIFEDREKNIWIGTRIGLKLLLSGDTARIIPIYHNPKKLESLIDNDVRSIMQDKKGDFWIGTLNGLSHFISKQQNEFTVVNFVSSKNNLNSLSDNWINTIIEGDNETIWFGTEKGGLNIYETKNNIFYSPGNKSQNPLYQNLFSKINMQVRVLKKDNSGQFWIGSRSGFYVFDPSSRQVHEFTINPDSPSSISDNSIRSIFIDRDGSFWIGTFYGGINIFNPMSKQFDHFKQPGVNSPLFYKIASALYEDFRRNIWISVEGKGIMCWNTQENSFKTYKYSAENPNSLSSDNVKCISPDGKEGLWIGTLNGLNYFSFNTNKFTRYFFEKGNPNTIPNDRVYDIESDREGNLWIATNGGGLCRYNKKEKNFETFHYILNNPNTIKTDNLTSLTLDSKNRLWIGATTGLNLRYPNGKIIRFTNINKKKETIDEKYICFVHEDRFKRIWIGTRGNGLFLYDEKTSDFKNYSIDDGLPGNNIIGVLEDEHGFLWLSTENGISKFDTEKNDFKNYTISDGLICKEFNYNSYLKDHTGKMYFGGYNGIVIFNPEDIKVNTAIPTMVFTNLKLFNNNSKKDLKSRISEQDISSSKSITIKSFQNVFTVEFALLNYINPTKNQYEYKLEGFEENWNKVSIPAATYMNLSQGTYTLLVKGSNNDGIWNEAPIKLTIKILPPFWKTWWAYLFYMLILFFSFFLYSRFTRVKLKLEQELYLEHIENKKQKELHQSKLRFFMNVSHEIRTPLTLIIGPLENLILKSEGAEGLKKQLLSINNNAKRLLRLINQLLDFRKQETGNIVLKVTESNIVKYIDDIILILNDFAHSKDIELNFHSSKTEINAFFDRQEFEKVLYNLITNAFKFLPAKEGRVDISLDSDDKWVIIKIKDNGKGIPGEHLEKIFDRFYQVKNSGIENFGVGIGLSLSKGIIELHHGTIQVESIESTEQKNGETVFTVKLPLGKDNYGLDEISNESNSVDEPELSAETLFDIELIEENKLLSFPLLNPFEKNKYTILIVDDVEEIRDFITEHLKENFTILEAENGEQAWNIVLKSLPDLIVSDVVMPKLDGIGLTNRIKNNEKTSHIPIILLTARTEIIEHLERSTTEADLYLTKPFNINILELKIRNLLRSHSKIKSKYSRIVTLEPISSEMNDPEEKFLQRLMGILENNIGDSEFGVSKLIEEIGMSRSALFKKSKTLLDMSIVDLIKTTRLRKATSLLKQRKMTISEISYAVGFTDSKYFSKVFHQKYGQTPSEYMKENNY